MNVSIAKIFPNNAAKLINDEIIQLIKKQKIVRIAFAGGNTPRDVNTILSEMNIPWDKIYLCWGDERMVPHDDSDSNYRMTNDSLIKYITMPPKGIFPIPFNKDPEIAAKSYENLLKNNLGDDCKIDIMLLGMGTDGHIASLFPNQNYNDNRIVVASVSPIEPSQRVSMSLAFIAKSTKIFIMINGESKAKIIEEIFAGKSGVPAAMLYKLRPDIIWLLDSSAAQFLTTGG